MFDNEVFAKNLKKLLSDRGEKHRPLADYMGYSEKMISNLVTGRTPPSIDKVVKIANYFDISIDELLGYDKESKERKKKRYINDIEKLSMSGQTEKYVQVCKDAISDFPGDLFFKYSLMEALWFDNKRQNAEEVIRWGNEILKHSVDNRQRYGAIKYLCRAHKERGDLALAEGLAEQMPDYYECKNELLREVKRGDASQLALCQRHIRNLVEIIGANIQDIVDSGALLKTFDGNGIDDSLYMLGFAIKCYQSLYPDGDYGPCHCRMVNLNMSMFEIYLMVNDEEKSLPYLKAAAEHAIFYDTQKGNGESYTSPMVKKSGEIVYNLRKDFEESECEIVLDCINKYYAAGNKPREILEIEERLKSVLKQKG